MRRTRTIALILGLITLLGLGGLVLGQPAEAPQPAAATAPSTAQPEASATATAPAATAETPPDGNASEGSESNETGTSEDEGESTLEEIVKAFEVVIDTFAKAETLGVLAVLIAVINLLILVLRYKKLDTWLEKKGWKKYKRIAAVVLGGALVGLTAAAGGAVWWKALIAGGVGIATGLASIGLHNLFTGGNADKKKKDK